MPERPGFQLKINGQLYEGWKSIEVDTAIDAMAAAFHVVCTDRYPGQPDQWPIKTGDKAEFLEGGELIATGWVDEVEPREDEGGHEVQIRGRGKTGDLVDCSAMNTPGRWSGRRLEQIVSDLCAPFGIGVTASSDTGPAFKAFALQQGEQVKDAIDRLVQQRGLLPIETPAGDLVLATPSQERAAGQLKLGLNVLKGEARHDARERFSDYVVKGNRQGRDNDHGRAATKVSAQAKDAEVGRYRPLMIMAEDQADAGSAQIRAKFAATVRAGRSQTGKLTVQGARDASGALWRHNRLVAVDAADLGLNGDLLIRAVKLKCADEGTTAEIDVIRPEAYSLGEVKGAGLSRLDSRHAGRGAKARKGRKGRTGGVDISKLAGIGG